MRDLGILHKSMELLPEPDSEQESLVMVFRQLVGATAAIKIKAIAIVLDSIVGAAIGLCLNVVAIGGPTKSRV